jgi:hypothetical protein
MAFANVLKTYAAALATVACAALAQPIEPTARPRLQPGWTEAELKAFSAGCTASILSPAKRDYAAAAAKANNLSPKPFPETEFLASVEPMCACIALRVAETRPLDAIQREGVGFAQTFIEQALSGGQCRPEGLLGRMLFDRKK